MSVGRHSPPHRPTPPRSPRRHDGSGLSVAACAGRRRALRRGAAPAAGRAALLGVLLAGAPAALVACGGAPWHALSSGALDDLLRGALVPPTPAAWRGLVAAGGWAAWARFVAALAVELHRSIARGARTPLDEPGAGGVGASARGRPGTFAAWLLAPLLVAGSAPLAAAPSPPLAPAAGVLRNARAPDPVPRRWPFSPGPLVSGLAGALGAALVEEVRRARAGRAPEGQAPAAAPLPARAPDGARLAPTTTSGPATTPGRLLPRVPELSLRERVALAAPGRGEPTGVREGGAGHGDPEERRAAVGGSWVRAEVGAEVVVRVLGLVEVDGAPGPFERPKVLESLVYLALRPAGASKEEWAEALWPGRAMSPSSLNTSIWQLRRALGTNARGERRVLPTRNGRLRLDASVTTDLALLERLAQSGDPGEWLRALELVRGRPFEGLGDPDWVVLDGVQARAEEAVVGLALRTARSCLAAGEPDGALKALRRGIQASPYDERCRRALVQAARAEGNLGVARAALRDLRRLLGEEERVLAEAVRSQREADREGGKATALVR